MFAHPSEAFPIRARARRSGLASCPSGFLPAGATLMPDSASSGLRYTNGRSATRMAVPTCCNAALVSARAKVRSTTGLTLLPSMDRASQQGQQR